MNPDYKVVWADAAEKDLRAIIDYIAVESSENALNVLRQFRHKASSLCKLPERGRIVPELHDQGINQYRELVVSPWRLIYRISDRDVYVMAVIDSRRNIEDILLRRLVDH